MYIHVWVCYCYQILVSTSTDIHENLALEDWIYENHDLNSSSVLLLYRDAPCVVVGRHQNPWVECDVPGIAKFGLKLARRKSGGKSRWCKLLI